MNILVTDKLTDEAMEHLKSQKGFHVIRSQTTHLKDENLSEVQVLLIRSRTEVDSQLLAKAPNLKAVVTATSGFDHIDLNACAEKQIQVAHTPNANAASAAELTWALVLACARQLPKADADVRGKKWNKELSEGVELEGKTYGVVGLGRIGQRVAKIANAFGMKVLAHDPYQEDDIFVATNAQRAGLDELLRQSDVISLHVPKTKKTHNLINIHSLEMISDTAILVNTSRGSAIREKDLCEALRAGEIGAVGLDVFEREPLSPDSPLLSYPNVVLSSHIGAKTQQAYQKASWDAAQAIILLAKGTDMAHRLPPQAAWYADL